MENNNNVHACFYCGTECVWQNDFSGEDYGLDDMELDNGVIIKPEDQIISIWICPHCGAEYEIRLRNE